MTHLLNDEDLIAERIELRLRAHAEEVPTKPLTGRWRLASVQRPAVPPARGVFGLGSKFAWSGMVTAATAAAVLAVALVASPHPHTAVHPGAATTVSAPANVSPAQTSSGAPAVSNSATAAPPSASATHNTSASPGSGPPAVAPSGTPAPTQIPSSNLVQNGSFENGGLVPWQLLVRTDLKNNSAAGTVGVDPANGCDGGASGLVDVTAADTTNPWHIVFEQIDFLLQSNRSYTLSFWAKADSNRDIEAFIQEEGGAYTEYLDQRNIALTTTCQHFSLTMPAQPLNATYPKEALRFALGQATGKVWIDGVSLS